MRDSSTAAGSAHQVRTPHRRIRSRALVGLAVAGVAVPAGLTVVPATSTPAQAVSTPVLVAVRAAQHTGYDRVVFEFTGRGPASATVGYVPSLVADASGEPVPVAGRAILAVVLRGVDNHTAGGRSTTPARQAFALKDVTSTVRSGDFEAVVSYGIGLQQKAAFHTHRLSGPARLVVDVMTPWRTVDRKVWFVDSAKVAANRPDPVSAVWRQVLPGTPATGLLDRVYAGPTAAEQAAGLRLTTSRSTGWRDLRVSSDGIARVRLTGGCGDGSAVVTVADEVFPTLRQLATVDHVKIYGPDGSTEHPTGHRDSIPECLEP